MMQTTSSISGVRKTQPLLIVVLAVLAASLLWFVIAKLHYVTDYSLSSYGDYFWPRRTGLIAHLSGGALAIFAGLVQIWLGLTSRVSSLHRALGKVYGVGVLVGSLGGFYLAMTIPDHLPYAVGLFMLNVAWLVTTGMAFYAIYTRRISQHREWMLRSYTVTFAFVSYRLAFNWLSPMLHLPDDPVANDLDTILAWACWTIPLLLAELLIQLHTMRRK
jgi:hypothetical protein